MINSGSKVTPTTLVSLICWCDQLLMVNFTCKCFFRHPSLLHVLPPLTPSHPSMPHSFTPSHPSLLYTLPSSLYTWTIIPLHIYSSCHILPSHPHHPTLSPSHPHHPTLHPTTPHILPPLTSSHPHYRWDYLGRQEVDAGCAQDHGCTDEAVGQLCREDRLVKGTRTLRLAESRTFAEPSKW